MNLSFNKGGFVEEKIEENQKIENQNLKNDEKKDKASLILFIIGAVLFGITLIMVIMFGVMSISFFTATGEEQLGEALGYIIYFAYFGFPALIIGLVSVILNIISVALSTRLRVVKITFMIFSILVVIADILLYILPSAISG